MKWMDILFQQACLLDNYYDMFYFKKNETYAIMILDLYYKLSQCL